MESLNPDTPFVTNDEISRILFHIASIIELIEKDPNPYRVRAYRRAAFGMLGLPRPLVDYVVAGVEPPLPGVGQRIRGRLRELVNTGHMGVYGALIEELGEPLGSLLALRGVGPKTAIRLVEELHIASLEDLAAAAKSGRIRALHDFGPKREASLGMQAEEILEAVA